MKNEKPKQAQKLEYLPILDLSEYEKNARTHSPEQVDQIAASIREFGFTNPVLVGADNDIIAGHGRVLAARKLGLVEVPCLRLGYLTEAQKRAYVIADNKLALNAGWDDELLKVELAGLRDEDGFDLGLTGFSEKELADLLAEVTLDGDETPDDGIKIKSTFEVVAECDDEDHQRMVYNILNEKGIKCRLATL